MEKINLLWTSGWDSTFRLLQLSEKEVEINLFYFIDHGRKSVNIEIERMEEILKKIKSLEKSKAKFNDIIYVEAEKVKKELKNDKITNSSKYLVKKYGIGTQYEWFALYCEKNNVDLEICLEAPLTATADAMKAEKCIFKNLEEEIFENKRLKLVKEGEKDNLYYLMKNFIFPVVTLTKKDMEKIAREKNWIEIMKLTWFCHQPINGKPCGYCNPCLDAMERGMEWRMPLVSRIRYYILAPIKLLYKKFKTI